MDDLRTDLEDAIDNQRFESDFPKGLDFTTIQYCIDRLLPVIKTYADKQVRETVGALKSKADTYNLAMTIADEKAGWVSPRIIAAIELKYLDEVIDLLNTSPEATDE